MNDQLYKNLRDILANKTENEAREYIVKHFSELPEDVQGAIAMDFFEEGLLKTTEKNKVIGDLQEKGLAVIKDLDEEKKLADSRLKLLA